MPLAAYSRLGPYEILALVGAGGMGEVYRAHDSRLGRDVAIKVCAERFHERFEREARSVAALNHPNICTLYDVGANYLVMEFIDGKELRGPLPLETALLYARQICDALEAAHNKEITHRDLKPANILIAASGVKLLDFGIAKSSAPKNAPSDATRTASLTQAGAAIGTAAYMSPEQARGEPVDARSDIFSFGLVLYEMLTGRRAFSRNTPVETIAAILRDEPTPFDTLPGVAAVLARCLAKSPDARFQRIGDVRSSLDNLAGTSAEPHPSVAVLPFANMSSDKENEYFSDGLAEEILNLLAKISGLKVIARTSSFAFRGKGEDVRKIASALGVTHVLEGSVRRVGNRLRITAQLIQALDGTHVWSERYDRDLTDIFAIQDEIGEAIVEALKLRLAGRAATVNVEAYQHFLRAKYYADLRTPESLAKAKDAFEKALLIDPDYAAAHGGLASYYFTLAGAGARPVLQVAPSAKLHAERSLSIDPQNGEAHSVLAIGVSTLDFDWSLAERHWRKALALEPVSPIVRFRYGSYYLTPLGRFDESREQCRVGLETDPVSMQLHFGMTMALYYGRRYHDAIVSSARALEIDSNLYLIHLLVGRAQLRLGLLNEAIPSLGRAAERAPWYGLTLGFLAAAHIRAGNRERAEEIGRKIAASHAGTIAAAVYHSALGETDAMFESLNQAYEKRDLVLWSVAHEPLFDGYREDERFRAFIRKLNLTAHKSPVPSSAVY